MPNKITLKEASKIHIGELVKLSDEQLLDLKRQAVDQLETSKRAKQWIDGVINMKHQKDD